ncbi:MAG: D-aminoacylase [Chloroflexi bacterium]|nr:D-aminoacylase [Chloroflexota bacterium]
MFDLLFKNARILDGTGNPWFWGDVAVKDDKIVAVGKLENLDAATTIDVKGKFLAPGFIDAHVHTDIPLLADPQFEACLRQGITTTIIGQDGISLAPASPATMEYMRAYFAAINTNPDIGWDWSTVAEFLSLYDNRVAINVAYLIPHGNLRMEAMGLANRLPSPAEMAHMQRLAAQGMREGAIGFSTGLDYIPCPYSDTQELVDIGKAVSPWNGVFVTHMRNYGDKVAEAVEETLTVGREAKIPVHISHYNGRADILLPLIDDGRRRGIDVTYDTYCYLAGCTILAMVALPQWVQSDGPQVTVIRLRQPAVREKIREWIERPTNTKVGMQNLQLTNVPGHPEEEGMRVTAAAERAGLSTVDYICDRLAETKMEVCALAHHTGLRSEEDMVRIMQHPAHMAGSDGIYSGSKPHPRGFGTFARYLAYHTRQRGDYSWEEAVRHMTWHAARRFYLHDRGLIHEGFAADIVVFDPDRIQDKATYENGHQYAEGVEHVVVNGKLELQDGEVTGILAGKALRKKQL